MIESLNVSPIWLPAICALLLTALSLMFLIRLAPLLGLMDIPTGRKDHAQPTPLVGGVAIMLSLLATAVIFRIESNTLALLICAMLVFLAGLMDDFRELSQYPRFAAQIIACALVLSLVDVPLRTVGNLLGFGPIGLWVFAYPVTVFAIVGVINAVNMSDGLDGLAGSQCLVAALAYAFAAQMSGLTAQAQVSMALAGGLMAFLVFNLRVPWRNKASVFLGDAGSMTIGFLLGWAAVDLTQGPGRTMPPICALWVVVLPLCDTVSLMLRRRAAGRSPMKPDREHIHHQLLARGFTVSQTVAILAGASALCASVGIGGWMIGTPEPILFGLFVILFLSHHYSSKRFWTQFHAKARETGMTEQSARISP